MNLIEKKAEEYVNHNFPNADLGYCGHQSERYKAVFIAGYEQCKKDTQRWHYPSKGELPNEAEVKDGEIIENVLVYTVSKQIRVGYYRNYEFCLCNGADLSPKLVIAWKYLPEPPKEIA